MLKVRKFSTYNNSWYNFYRQIYVVKNRPLFFLERKHTMQLKKTRNDATRIVEN